MSWQKQGLRLTINIFLQQCEWFMVSGEQCFGNYNSKVINPWITIKMNYCYFKKNYDYHYNSQMYIFKIWIYFKGLGRSLWLKTFPVWLGVCTIGADVARSEYTSFTRAIGQLILVLARPILWYSLSSSGSKVTCKVRRTHSACSYVHICIASFTCDKGDSSEFQQTRGKGQKLE